MKKHANYFAWGLTAVLVVCTVLLFYDFVFRNSIILEYVSKFLHVMSPVLYGLVIAYLLSPVVNFFERVLFQHGGRKAPAKIVRALSILLTWLVVVAFLYGLVSILVPELYRSVLMLVDNAQDYYNKAYEWVMSVLDSNPKIAETANELINKYYTDVLTWVNTNWVPQLRAAVQAFTGGVLGTLDFLKNLLLGMIVSIYLMASKEGFLAASRRLCYVILPEEASLWFFRGLKAVNGIFSSFVRGKLLDSLIIGVICFVGASLLDLPYTPLVSVVVGVTNVIPFFGPVLGAIPCGFLILLDTPIKALYFGIFILVLQQFDGNVLGPKILGNSTGIPGFWVMVAIFVGGGFWGVAGMFLGVPMVACMYAAVQYFSGYVLGKKGLPTDVWSYAGGDVDPSVGSDGGPDDADGPV